jgi:2-oxoisovalerate dehydrogenase E1 component
MKRDPAIVVFGEDVADAFPRECPGGVQGQGGRLQADVEPAAPLRRRRVFNSPLAEANIVGRAIGWRCAG